MTGTTTTVQIQHFTTPGAIAAAKARIAEQAEADQAYAQLARDTGFEIKKLDKSGATQERLATATTLYGAPLSGGALRTWQQFLPTQRRPEKYNFDRPPTEVLEAIADAQSLDIFDRIQIWSPEGNDLRGRLHRYWHDAQDKLERALNQIDPMAVGIIDGPSGPVRYSIVRWGESLPDMTEIRAQVRKVTIQMQLLKLMPAVFFAIGVISWGFGADKYGLETMFFGTIITLCAICAMILGALEIYQRMPRWMRRRR